LSSIPKVKALVKSKQEEEAEGKRPISRSKVKHEMSEMELLELFSSDPVEPDQEEQNVKPNLESPSFLDKNAPPSRSISTHDSMALILAIVPGIHPSYVQHLLKASKAGENIDSIVAELLDDDYPLASGGYRFGGVRPMYVVEKEGGECQSCGDEFEASGLGASFPRQRSPCLDALLFLFQFNARAVTPSASPARTPVLKSHSGCVEGFVVPRSSLLPFRRTLIADSSSFHALPLADRPLLFSEFWLRSNHPLL
jgi:hypothetical protein